MPWLYECAQIRNRIKKKKINITVKIRIKFLNAFAVFKHP